MPARERLRWWTISNDHQMSVPYLPSVNPFLWELGHGIWFQEYWVLRHALSGAPLLEDPDHLFDSAHVGPRDALAFEHAGTSRGCCAMGSECGMPFSRDSPRVNPARSCATSCSCPCFTRTCIGRRSVTCARLSATRRPAGSDRCRREGTRRRPGRRPGRQSGTLSSLEAGSTSARARGEPFVFDNEKWAHPVDMEAFRIARSPVTQAQFLEFVEDRGYQRSELWSDRGWRWRLASGAERPVYWRLHGDVWQRRVIDTWRDLEANVPVVHVNWYEADAWCRVVGTAPADRA